MAVFVAYLYQDLSATEELAAGEQSKLTAAGGRMDTVDGSLATLVAEITKNETQTAQIEADSGLIGQTPEELAKLRIDWKTALQALFGADGPGILLTRVVAEPDGKLAVTGTIEGVDSVARFNEHMRSVEEVLALRNLQLEEGESILVFNADVEVR